MVTGRIFVAREQEGTDLRDQHLALEGFNRQRRHRNFSDTVQSRGDACAPRSGMHVAPLAVSLVSTAVCRQYPGQQTSRRFADRTAACGANQEVPARCGILLFTPRDPDQCRGAVGALAAQTALSCDRVRLTTGRTRCRVADRGTRCRLARGSTWRELPLLCEEASKTKKLNEKMRELKQDF